MKRTNQCMLRFSDNEDRALRNFARLKGRPVARVARELLMEALDAKSKEVKP